MTKEQAIEKIQAIIDCDLRELNTMPQHEALQNEVEALEMAIKSLAQPTSDDCVSRQVVFDELNRLGRNAFKDDTDYDNFFAFVDSLPPVIPTRKSGLRWIERFDNESMWLECPYCHIDSIAAYNYCPNCGASFKEKRGNENG